jgi:exopolysaccharide biosynthesis protein
MILALGRHANRGRALALVILTLAASSPVAAQTGCNDNPWATGWAPLWQPIFQGIDWAGACTTRLPTNPGIPGVRTQNANILRIDLTAPGIQLVTTPHSGAAETTGQVASQFLCANEVQVAVNANFFSPCCANEPTPPSSNLMDLCGLAIAEGQVVSSPASGACAAGAAALLVTKDNQASIRMVTGLVPAGIYNAVAGSPQPSAGACPQTVPGPILLVLDGVNLSSPETDGNPPESVAARTAVGLSRDGRTLYLLTLDGTDGSSRGAGFYDTAQWLIQLGADRGLNLDGGGSTTMAMQQPGGGGVLILNSPNEACCQRYVGAFLGVRAAPLTSPFVPPGCGTRSCSQPAVSCTGN